MAIAWVEGSYPRSLKKQSPLGIHKCFIFIPVIGYMSSLQMNKENFSASRSIQLPEMQRQFQVSNNNDPPPKLLLLSSAREPLVSKNLLESPSPSTNPVPVGVPTPRNLSTHASLIPGDQASGRKRLLDMEDNLMEESITKTSQDDSSSPKQPSQYSSSENRHYNHETTPNSPRSRYMPSSSPRSSLDPSASPIESSSSSSEPSSPNTSSEYTSYKPSIARFMGCSESSSFCSTTFDQLFPKPAAGKRNCSPTEDPTNSVSSSYLDTLPTKLLPKYNHIDDWYKDMDSQSSGDHPVAEKTFQEKVQDVLNSAWTVKTDCTCDDCKYTNPTHVASLASLRKPVTSHDCHVCKLHRAATACLERQLSLCPCFSCTSARTLGTPSHDWLCSCHPCAGQRCLRGAKSRGEEAKNLVSLLQPKDMMKEREIEGNKIEKTSEEAISQKHMEENRKKIEIIEIKFKEEAAEMKRITEAARWMREQEGGKQGQKFAVFGTWMPGLVREVHKSKRFLHIPIGPLGEHITLKQGCSEELARAVEGELGHLLSAFLCDNTADEQVLAEIFDKQQIRAKPLVFKSTFSNTKQKIEMVKVKSNLYKTLIDCVDINNVNVFNLVVNSCHLDKILYIPTEVEARLLLSNPQSVPRHLLHATSPGHLFFPAPNFGSCTRPETRRGLLRASEAAVVDLTTSAGCGCDDCRFVTAPHVARMKAKGLTCRCHPCSLDRDKGLLGSGCH